MENKSKQNPQRGFIVQLYFYPNHVNPVLAKTTELNGVNSFRFLSQAFECHKTMQALSRNCFESGVPADVDSLTFYNSEN